MTRQKVKLSFIANEAARRATFKKRKSGILKKAHELSTLCGVAVGVLVNNPNDSNMAMEVWPTREGFNGIVSQYFNLPEMERNKRMMDQETYLKQRIDKATEALRKLRKENRELEMEEVMFSYLGGKILIDHANQNDLRDLVSVIEQKIKDLNHESEIRKKNAAAAAAVTTVNFMPMPPVVDMATSAAGFFNGVRIRFENTLNVKHTNKDLDLNKKQW